MNIVSIVLKMLRTFGRFGVLRVRNLMRKGIDIKLENIMNGLGVDLSEEILRNLAWRTFIKSTLKSDNLYF